MTATTDLGWKRQTTTRSRGDDRDPNALLAEGPTLLQTTPVAVENCGIAWPRVTIDADQG